MLKFLKSLFSKTTFEYRILEVETPRKLPQFDDNIRNSVAVLGDQPGFQFLTAKLRATGAALEERLRKGQHGRLEDVAYLQHGIFWCRWLQDELDQATKRRPRETQAPVSEEALAFTAAQSLIERVE